MIIKLSNTDKRTNHADIVKSHTSKLHPIIHHISLLILHTLKYVTLMSAKVVNRSFDRVTFMLWT